MAKQKSIILITGKLGDKIGFRRNGEYFFRSTPRTVRQTLATRRASRRFGTCSTKGRLIRHACYPDLDVKCDGAHVNRLNRLLIEAAGDLSTLKGFRFNSLAGIDRFFTVAPDCSRKNVLHIPAQNIIQYDQFTALEVTVIAVRIDFHTHRITGTDSTVMVIDSQNPFNGADIPLYVSGEGTLLVTLQVRGLLQDGVSANKQYLAADIVAITAPAKPQRRKIHTHPTRTVEQSLKEIIPLPGCSNCGIVQRE